MAFEVDVRKTLVPIVMGVVLIFVGLTSANIAGGIGQYVVSTLNDSLNGAITINLFSDNVITLMGTVFLMAGIALIVTTVAYVIYALWQSTQTVSGL